MVSAEVDVLIVYANSLNSFRPGARLNEESPWDCLLQIRLVGLLDPCLDPHPVELDCCQRSPLPIVSLLMRSI